MKQSTTLAPLVPVRGFPLWLCSPTSPSPLVPKFWAYPMQAGGRVTPPPSSAIQRIRNRCVAQTSNSESSCSEEEGAVHTRRAASPVHLDGLSARRVVLERVRMQLHSRGSGTSTEQGSGGFRECWFDDSQTLSEMQIDSMGDTSDHEGGCEGIEEATKHGLKRTMQGEVCSEYDPCGGYEAGDERTEGKEDEPPFYNASKKKPR